LVPSNESREHLLDLRKFEGGVVEKVLQGRSNEKDAVAQKNKATLAI
jgi:hypothetical protein